MAKRPDPYGTNGGNGGYNRKSQMATGFDKPLKTTNTGKFAASGVTQKSPSKKK